MDAYTVRKRFPEWIKVKAKLHKVGRTPHIKEGEIWWCAVGENVGVEINGKGVNFARPVLVFKKLNRYYFYGIPLTTKEHYGVWYASFIFKGRTEYACLAQSKSISSSRLYSKLGEVPESDLKKVAQGLHNLYFGKKKCSLVSRLGWCGYPRKFKSIILHAVAKVKTPSKISQQNP